MKKILFTFLFITTIFAQDVVSIVTSGDGSTKDQATTAALRNAIEQAYGAFISSNTKFLNDELIQDEIVSLSQGTITEYSIISFIETKNGYNVTTKSTVSLGKLTSFVESKGGETELAGSSFVQNIKLLDFYELNEELALNNIYLTLKEMSANQFFDYIVDVVYGPVEINKFDGNVSDLNMLSICNDFEQKKERGRYHLNSISGNNKCYLVTLNVQVIPNENFFEATDFLYKSLSSLTIQNTQVYDEIQRKYYPFKLIGYAKKSIKPKLLKNFYKSSGAIIANNSETIHLRNSTSERKIQNMLRIFNDVSLNFSISNNITEDFEPFLKNKTYLQNPYKNWHILSVKNSLIMSSQRYMNSLENIFKNIDSYTQDDRLRGKKQIALPPLMLRNHDNTTYEKISVIDFQIDNVLSMRELESLKNYSIKPVISR